MQCTPYGLVVGPTFCLGATGRTLRATLSDSCRASLPMNAHAGSIVHAYMHQDQSVLTESSLDFVLVGNDRSTVFT